MLARLLSLGTFLAIGTSLGWAQTAPTEGIRIDHPLTIAKCGGCHQRDANGMMRRLSYIRTSPEVWEQAIKRMVRLNGLSIKPEEAREVLQFLASNNGLAPEEEKPVFWEAEHRLFRDQSDKIPDDALQHTCNYCHTIGRVLTQRRTRDDYEKLVNMHLGMFPGSENTLKPRAAASRPETPVSMSAPTGGNPAVVVPPSTVMSPTPNVPALRTDGKYPADIAVDYLAKAQPLLTPEWTAWKASMQSPKLAGRWQLTGYQQGKGRVFGVVTITAGANPDEFVTKTELEYASTGNKLSRTGKSIVYTGYSWRGRSTGTGTEPASADPGTNPKEWREALFLNRDGNTLDGRFFWGGYQEFGLDVHMTRIGAEPILSGASVLSLMASTSSQMKLYGANIPAGLKPTDVDLGPGVTVLRVLQSTPSVATIEVAVDAKAPSGIRAITMLNAKADRAIAVYDKMSYVKITPDASMARLGGITADKQFAQFEAIAYANGADGKPQTADDIPLGSVPARWSMTEFVSTPNDDDMQFVGTINDTGLFTPNIEGPNPARQKQANNFPTNNWGDVWVEATYTPPGGKEMKARSYLVVTIPVYVRYDQPEVGQ